MLINHFTCRNCHGDVDCLDLMNYFGGAPYIEGQGTPHCFFCSPVPDRFSFLLDMVLPVDYWCTGCLIEQIRGTRLDTWQAEWHMLVAPRVNWIPLPTIIQQFGEVSCGIPGSYVPVRPWTFSAIPGLHARVVLLGTDAAREGRRARRAAPAPAPFVPPTGALLCACNTCERILR